MTNNIEKILHKKREELEQKLADAKNVVTKIKSDIESLDKAILICSPDYKIEVAGTKKCMQIFKPREFKNLLIPFLKSHNDFVDAKAVDMQIFAFKLFDYGVKKLFYLCFVFLPLSLKSSDVVF